MDRQGDKGIGAGSLADVISNLLTGREYEWIYRCIEGRGDGRRDVGKIGSRKKPSLIIAALRSCTDQRLDWPPKDFFPGLARGACGHSRNSSTPRRMRLPLKEVSSPPPVSFNSHAEIFADSSEPLETSCRNAIWIKGDHRLSRKVRVPLKDSFLERSLIFFFSQYWTRRSMLWSILFYIDSSRDDREGIREAEKFTKFLRDVFMKRFGFNYAALNTFDILSLLFWITNVSERRHNAWTARIF